MLSDNNNAGESQLYLLRLWKVVVTDGTFERRGRVLHVPSGKARNFRDWGSLIEWLDESAPALEDSPKAGQQEHD